MAGPRGANVGTQTTVGGKEARRGGGELIQPIITWGRQRDTAADKTLPGSCYDW